MTFKRGAQPGIIVVLFFLFHVLKRVAHSPFCLCQHNFRLFLEQIFPKFHASNLHCFSVTIIWSIFSSVQIGGYFSSIRLIVLYPPFT